MHTNHISQTGGKPMEVHASRPLKAGQVVLGKVLSIFPNQTAMIQAGSKKLAASLEVPLEAGNTYWLQVQPGEGRTALKVVGDGAVMKAKGSAAELLAQIGLPVGKDSASLAEFLLKEGLPITKGTFEPALTWMKASGMSEDAFNAIRHMHSRDLPFIKEVFDAVMSRSGTATVHELGTRLLDQLGQKTEGTLQGRLSALLEQLVLPKESQAGAAANSLLSMWADPENPVSVREGAYALLRRTGLFSTSEQDLLGSLKSLKNQPGDHPLIKGMQLTALYRTILENGNAGSAAGIRSRIGGLLEGMGQPVPVLSGLTEEADWLIKAMAAGAIQSEGDQAAGLIPGAGSYSRAKEILAAILQSGAISEQAENPALRLLLETDWKAAGLSQPREVFPYLKDMVRLLGLDLENRLSAGAGGYDPDTALKPLLLKLLQEEQPPAVRELASQLIHKLTAQQLSAAESGPIQHLQIQIPLGFAGMNNDLTIEWNGRRTEKGSIDPDYCRILFYLELEHLSETVVDMQIQNRVIRLSVLNERPEVLEKGAAAVMNGLKERLAKLDYTLSGLRFEKPASVRTAEKAQAGHRDLHYSGMDLRI